MKTKKYQLMAIAFLSLIFIGLFVLSVVGKGWMKGRTDHFFDVSFHSPHSFSKPLKTFGVEVAFIEAPSMEDIKKCLPEEPTYLTMVKDHEEEKEFGTSSEMRGDVRKEPNRYPQKQELPRVEENTKGENEQKKGNQTEKGGTSLAKNGQNTQEPIMDESNPQKEETDLKDSSIKNHQLIDFELEVIRLTNEVREKHGLKPLQADPALSYVARKKSDDMVSLQYFDHYSPTFGTLFQMLDFFGIQYSYAGENLAYGFRTPEKVMDAWMESDGHRKNVLKDIYTHIGVGYNEKGHYWTMQLIRK